MELQVKALMDQFEAQQRALTRACANMFVSAWNSLLNDLKTQRERLLADLSKNVPETPPTAEEADSETFDEVDLVVG
jgi:hypothetical protein